MLSKVVVGLVMLGFVVALVGAAGMVNATKGEGGDFHKKHPNGRCEDRYFPNYPPEGQGWEPGRCPEETPEPTEEPEETPEPTLEVTPVETEEVEPTQEATDVVDPTEESTQVTPENTPEPETTETVAPEETEEVEPTETQATPAETQVVEPSVEPEETQVVDPTEPVETETQVTEIPTEPVGTEAPTEPAGTEAPSTEAPALPTEVSPAPAVQSAPPLCTDAFGPFLKVAAGELSWYFVTGGWIDGSFYLNEASYALGGTLTEEDPYMAGNYSLVLCQNVTILFKVHGELAGIARIQNAVVTDAYILANGLLVFKPMAHQQ